jgi:hypothetical protein
MIVIGVFEMKELVGKPKAYVVSVYTITFNSGDPRYVRPEVARFIETSFVVLHEPSEKEIQTPPIVHSMN